MNLVQTPRFLAELEDILFFIAQDNLNAALSFQAQLEQQLISLALFPYQHRQSTKSTDPSIRDLIFKGYVIPYRVNQAHQRLEVLSRSAGYI